MARPPLLQTEDETRRRVTLFPPWRWGVTSRSGVSTSWSIKLHCVVLCGVELLRRLRHTCSSSERQDKGGEKGRINIK